MFLRCFAALLCCLLFLTAQPRLTLSVDTVMRGPGLYGYSPQSVRWSGDSSRIYFRWKRHDEPATAEYSTYVVHRDGSGLKKLSEEEARQAPPTASDDTLDWKLSVYAEDGDIFLYDQISGRRRRLTHTADIESSPRFTLDQKRIAFVRGNNLYVLSPADGSMEQLTDIRTGGRDDEEKKGTDSQEFLKKEEKDLLDYVRERARKTEEDRAKRKKENPRKSFRLTARQSLRGMQLSLDETTVAAIVVERPESAKQTAVPAFITESAYTAELPARAKAGDAQARTRVLFLDAATGEPRWLDAGIQEEGKDGKKRDRDLRFSRFLWSDDGSKLAAVARSADHKDAWILAADPKTGKARTIVAMHDDAWIGGPAPLACGWLPGNQRLYFTWERDGWSHLYTVPFAGGEPKQLTSGKWEVRDVSLAAGKGHFLLTTSEVHPGEEHLYSMSLDGGPRTRLTSMPGAHDAKLAPDGGALASVYSYVNRPPELYLLDLRNRAAKPVQITDSPAPDFKTFPWLDVPIVHIPARDGASVPARLYKGPAFQRGGPLVLFVHGAGYLQNVHRKWSPYAREYMFHHLLMERGYMVLDVDYRASAGYGRDWRTAIYRHMGGKDLDDHVDAVRWAVQQHGVDPKRVG
ncbi:MAG: DPP IV N-terminal domain-containing protein, partial [Bryobacterales bacterium]|nr:DPP IV N-terminal domain-containing protein [Bryobacterales bacterium]